MPPRPRRRRDYPAEYQRRLALEVERARERGIPFSRARARGHPESVPGTLSVSELRVGRLSVRNLQFYGDLNRRLGQAGVSQEAVDLTNRYGFRLEASRNGRLFTLGLVPPEMVARMNHRSRQIFFGY